MRMCVATALVIVCAAGAATAGDDPPASHSISAQGCFTRSYDGEHLKRHPGQKTVAARASFGRQTLWLALAEASRTSYISASCDWREQAGRDVGGKPLLAAFKGKAAYDCIVTYSEESAEEGGYLIFAPAPDAQSATIYLDSPVAARAALDGKGRPIVLGPEDRVFKLARASPSVCEALGR